MIYVAIISFLQQSDRLKLVLDHLNTLDSLCGVLGLDFKQTVHEVHPSLDRTQGSSVSNDTIEKLASAVERLRAVKIQRMQKVRESDLKEAFYT